MHDLGYKNIDYSINICYNIITVKIINQKTKGGINHEIRKQLQGIWREIHNS